MTRSARRRLFLSTALAGTLLHGAARAADLPVVNMDGGATITPITAPGPPATTTGLKVDLNNANRIIDWTSFDVAANKAVNFTTADTAGRYAVLNRVAAGDASDVFGTITSTGNIAVWLSNPAGITFGAGVDSGGNAYHGSFSGGSLVLTTATVNAADWAGAIASADPASYFIGLTGAAGAITLAGTTTITATAGRFVAAAPSVTAAGTIAAAGGEAELVAATDLALPFGAGSPLGVRIDKGTAVGKVTVQGTAVIDAAVIRLAGASTGAQAAYLLQVDDGAQLTASVAGGKVILAAGVGGDGVALGGVPANVSGAASIQYDGKASATGGGGTATLGASGDIVTTTARGTIDAASALGITAAGKATIGAALSSSAGDVTVLSGGATLVQSAVGAGGAYTATGASVTLGTAGTVITQTAKGAVTITAKNGLLSGLDGLALQSGNGGADAALTLSQAGTGGIVFAPATELVGGTFAAGPPVAYGFGADVVVSAIAAGQPLTLGNVHARALTLPAGLTGTITAGDIVVDGTLTLNTGGAIRLRSGTSRTGDVALTATGDVTGLARTTAATDGRLAPGYDRADLTAQTVAATVKVTATAGTAQLGTIAAGTGTTAAAGDQATVDAQAIDIAAATSFNGALRLTSTGGEVRLGSGTGGSDATVAAATSARIGSLTAAAGNLLATAASGDVTGLARPAAATDGRLVAGYDRADLAATAANGTITVMAGAGTAQLGMATAGTGPTTAAGDEIAVDAQAIDVATATARNGALRLTSRSGEVRLDEGMGATDATVAAATSARIRSLTARTGAAAATAAAGDVTGLALPAPATDGRLVADYDRAGIVAQSASGTVSVKAASGYAQLGTVAAGAGTATAAGEQAGVDARAIDATFATARNGALRLTSMVGEVRLGTGIGGTDATVTAATSARIGSLTARTGAIAVTARAGDATGLALAPPAADGRLVPGYDRADLTAQAAAGTIAVKAALGNAQLGTVTAGSGAAAALGDQIAVNAQAIDAVAATALNGALRLTSSLGEVRLVAGSGGTDGAVQAATGARIGSLAARTGNVLVTAADGDVTGLLLPAPATDGRLVEAYGRADLSAQAADRTVAVTAGMGYAQLGTVAAGAGTTTPAGDQIAVEARAIDAIDATAQNGALRLTSTVGEVRLASGRGGTGGTVDAKTNARVGDLTTRTGAIAITARAGDATGVALPAAAADSRPETGYGLTALDAGTAITVAASDDVQLGTIRAGGDIAIDAHPADPATASATAVAWAGGPVTAAGHYRVTGGSVVLGAPGGISQSAGADLIVRSLAGDIGGGDALALASGVGNTGAANQLILYSAGAIALPATATLTAGGGQYADIGLAAPAGLAITLGSAAARRIGSAVIDAAQPTGYRVDRALALPNPITARKLVTTADLVIDTTGDNSAADIVLDEAQSTAGGINLATLGDVRGRLLSGPPALYQRSRLAAFDGVVVTSRLALLDTVTAGTGVDIAAGRLDALGIAGNAGDVVLRTAGDMLVDGVVAHGNGGDGPATMLADPTIPLSAYATPGTIRTAGDIAATSSGDIAGATTGFANFGATDGAVTLVSDATGTDKGLLALGTVTASGTTAGHSDASLTGRQIDVATNAASTAGSIFVTARELGSQTQVGATIARAAAARDVTIAIGYGTAPAGTADNGSLRFGTVQAAAGDVRITARDGSVTGLAGTTDGLDPAHARPTVTAGGDATVTAGRLVQLGDVSGQDVNVAAGDDVLAEVAQQGVVAHQDGAIDIAHLVARGALTLTAAHGATADGISGIRLGALASGLADGGAASQAGTSATLRTLGARGDIVVADGLTAQGDLAAAGVASIRASTLTSATGGIALNAAGGDVTGLVLPAAATDGRMIAGYDRAILTALAAGQPIAVKAAAGIAQLGAVAAGTGTTPSAGEQIGVDAQAIDVTTATARNGALRLSSTVGEVRLAAGVANTGATIGAAGNARIGTLAARTGSIGVTAGGGDVTGLALTPAAGDGRMIPDYGRAVLTAQAERTDVTVNATGTAQLDTVTTGTGDATSPTGGIAVAARAIDLLGADARNAALQLTSTGGETRLVAGAAGTDATILAADAARIGALTARTGAIAVTAAAGDVTGLVRPGPAGDGRLAAGYDRADLTTLAAAQPIAVRAAAGNVQLGTALAGAGPVTSAGDQIAVDAQAIDVAAATAQNGALRLTATAGEVRLASGNAGTDATIGAAASARIGTLAARTGSIAVTATAGDVTGLALAPAATDGRLVPDYDRADLAALAAGTNVAVTAAAGTAQLGTVAAGIGDATAPAGGIAVDARAIDVVAAAARNAALRLTATAGDVRLATGAAGTDAAVQAAASARIGTLATRTGSIAVTATAGDVTGLALAPAATDGRLAPAFGRADLTAQAAARNVTVNAAGVAQIGMVGAGAGDATTPAGGIAVTAGAIDITTAAARNAAITLTSNVGETRLAAGTAATDAAVRAATSARIGTLSSRTGSIAATAVGGDVSGLAQADASADGRLVAGYGRADLAAPAAAKTIAVAAAAGGAQLGAVTAGTGAGTAGEQVAVDARAIDVTTADAKDGALRLTATAGETRIATGNAATDATIRAAASARIGDLTARTGAIAVTAAAGDVTGLAATTPAGDTRPFAGFGRANLTAPSATRSVTVAAAAGTAQLGTVAAGPDALSTGGGGIAVTARAIDVATASARNGALALTATLDRLYLGQGIAATTATLDKQGTADELHVTGALAAAGNATLASTTDIDLPTTPAAIGSGDTLTLRNSGANATLLGGAATGAGFTLSEAEVNGVKAPKLMIDARATPVTIGALAFAAAAGSGEVDLLGTGGFTITGGIANTGGGARALQIGGAAATADAPAEPAIAAGTTLASSISGEIDNGAAIDWSGGTLDLRAGTILFGNQALRNVAVGTPEAIAIDLVARSNSPLYIGALGTTLQNKVFLTALKLKVSYTGYALFQNTNLPATPAGVAIGPQDRSVTNLALQLFSTGETPANSFALFGTINGFQGRTAGVLPAEVIDFADLNPRVVRITQSNSRINGCVIGSPDKGCLVTDAPPPNFQLFDERQILLFGTADDAGLTFDPLIGTNNESLIGDIDSATLGINSIDCSAPGTRDCPAAGERQ